jgi:hypothetical protein
MTATALDFALTQIRVRETGPNRGPEVDTFLRAVGLDPEKGSYPWCAAFAYWCCHQALLWIPRTASVAKLLDRATALVVAEPRPGDICTMLRMDGKGHCGIFVRKFTGYDGADWIETCDGNTNQDGSREGDRVAMKERPLRYWNRAFLRPTRLETDIG